MVHDVAVQHGTILAWHNGAMQHRQSLCLNNTHNGSMGMHQYGA